MSVIQAIVLAIIQGVTEFLPISSSGHLVLGSWLFNWPDQGLTFDAAVHVGTLGSVLVYFRTEWFSLARGCVRGGDVIFGGNSEGAGSMKATRLLFLLVLATLPLVVVGPALGDAVEGPMRSPEVVGALLLVTAAVLTAAEIVGNRTRGLSSTGPRDSFLIGLAQTLAVLPGVSRAGVTIAAGMFLNMTRESAARFSFLLAVPAIAGSGVLVLAKSFSPGADTDADWTMILIGVVISFLTGYLAIGGLLRVLRTWSFKPFIAYTLFAGIAVLSLRALGF